MQSLHIVLLRHCDVGMQVISDHYHLVGGTLQIFGDLRVDSARALAFPA